ncbi:MAG: hypothetical protein F6K40_39785 [Okeania sp. SIO3I5]|uniref:hypothetical protein n=1 Tax=Okeania sp. SIO3I5 TaxID=2607805 RepID=UPI0013B8E33A|nr:hypothetical protein [Okeania sp. SIO3I5]NEQ41995.1 hypothetical protein [Okeania sp. SIO3I5]
MIGTNAYDRSDDEADSLALGCYWFDYGDNPRRFLSRRDPVVAEIRDLVMRRISYEREVGRLVNICHQDLDLGVS